MHGFALLKNNRKQNQKHLNVISILRPHSKRQLKGKKPRILEYYRLCFLFSPKNHTNTSKETLNCTPTN